MSQQRLFATAAALLLAVVIVSCSSTSTAPDPVVEPAGVELAYAWRAGETLPFEMVNQIRQHMTVEMDSEEAPAVPSMEMTIDQVLTGGQEVLEVTEDGTARVRLSYDTLRMDVVSPMMSMSWDSEKPGDDEADDEAMAELETSLRPLLDHPLTLEITSDGEILSVEGIEAITEAMMAAAGASAEMMGSMGGIDDATIEQMIQQSFFSLPTGPVAPGDSWSARLESPIPFVGGLLVGDIQFTLESVTDGLAVIDLAGTYGYQPSDEPTMFDQMMASLGDVETDISIEGGDFDGELLFDVAEGRYDTVRSSLAMGLTMSMTPGAEAPETMPRIRMAMDMEMESTVEYGEPAARSPGREAEDRP